jgi:hypothetical protein
MCTALHNLNLVERYAVLWRLTQHTVHGNTVKHVPAERVSVHTLRQADVPIGVPGAKELGRRLAHGKESRQLLAHLPVDHVDPQVLPSEQGQRLAINDWPQLQLWRDVEHLGVCSCAR